jgi:hypothetical protein
MLVSREPPPDVSADPRAGSERCQSGDRDPVRGARGSAGMATTSIRDPNVYRTSALPLYRDLALTGPNDRSSDDRAGTLEVNRRRCVRAASVDAPTACAYHDGSRDPISWSPFLRVGARTLRTEQCAKSQCVYPVDIGRCGSPCLPARRSYGRTNEPQEGRSGCAARGGRLSNNEPETGPQGTDKEPDGAGSNGSLRRV